MNDKIKHLIDTASKTDAMARNKWRIENREQLREQRKQELKELMEKDKQDHIVEANKMVSSVEWLEAIIKHCERFGTSIEQKDIEQAKVMERKQHGKTWDDAMENIKARGGNDMRAWADFDDYFNETYGGNNEQ